MNCRLSYSPLFLVEFFSFTQTQRVIPDENNFRVIPTNWHEMSFIFWWWNYNRNNEKANLVRSTKSDLWKTWQMFALAFSMIRSTSWYTFKFSLRLAMAACASCMLIYLYLCHFFRGVWVCVCVLFICVE